MCCQKLFDSNKQNYNNTKKAPVCIKMLSMFKTSIAAEWNNPFSKKYALGKQVGSAGPEMVWKIYDATRLQDNKVGCSMLLFQSIACQW